MTRITHRVTPRNGPALGPDLPVPAGPTRPGRLTQVAQFVDVNNRTGHFSWTSFGSPCARDSLPSWEATPRTRHANASIDELLLEIGRRRWATNTDEPHWVLAQAPFPVFVTTTLNGLMAEALKAAGKKPREELFRWNEEEGWPTLLKETEPDYTPTPEEPLVYHLFGRLGVDHSLVITEDDYFDYLIGAAKNREQIPSVVRARLAETALLFLGFEMDGWDFRVLFRSIVQPDPAVETQADRPRRRSARSRGGPDPRAGPGTRYLQKYFEFEISTSTGVVSRTFRESFANSAKVSHEHRAAPAPDQPLCRPPSISAGGAAVWPGPRGL